MSKGVLILIIFTVFLVGLVAGMLLIHFAAPDKSATEAPQDIKMTLASEKHVTNVYIPKRERILGQIAKNGYITENFEIENGFMTYKDETGNKISHLGLDLSYHDKSVDWDQLAASGVEFVMLRCGYRGYTEGGLIKDEKFDEYAAEANRVGINLGVYFFTQSVTVEEAEKEAEFVLDLIKDYDISYPVALDTEMIEDPEARTNTTEISKDLRSEMAIAFCEKIKEEGYYPVIYASENWMRRNMNLEMVNVYDFWAAQYQPQNDFLYDFTIWQYTDSGAIPGVSGNVDLDISLIDYSEFVPALREAVVSEGEIVEGEGAPSDTVVIEEVVEEE